ncbi:non-ribosomal peptide synthetase [Kitasatospora sp. NPDC093806]|uniref:non-ribosomal peptide synthetase n=1 Tax=Kitasatospora sp. NPDC093806 TaxID=3155075 RepID=UPI003421471E
MLTENATTARSAFVELFAAQVARDPDAVAVRFGEQTLDYRELDLWSGRIAARLAEQGVGPGSLVALAADRGFAPLVGVLAVLKAGAGYLGLDPSTPARRQRRMIEETAPDCVLAEPGLDRFPTLDAPRVRLAPVTEGPTLGEPATASAPEAERTFHVVYTSGSTGDPKGVRISHRSVLNRLQWMWRDHPFPAGAVLAVQKSHALVASPWELLGGLLQGIPSVVLAREEVLDPALLADAVERERITHLFLTPHLIDGLLDEAERRPDTGHRPVLVTSGADALPVETVRRFHRRYPGATLLNLYGMTETASNVAAFDTSRLAADAERVPVGLPVAGARITVRDRFERELPPGAVGEVWVSGPPLALGYLADGLSADRFVPAPDGTPSYRTGDRGRLLPGGELEITGRGDNQVKIRGYRVELEEVEATLRKAPFVTGAGAFLGELNGRPELQAVVTTDSGSSGNEGGADPAAIRAFLRDRLPDYMLPAVVLLAPALPTAANGKLDRTALAALADRARDGHSGGFTPADPLETTVAGIWEHLLGTAPADRASNFFDAGGHSLLAVRLANRLERALGRRVTLRQVLADPTFTGLVSLAREDTE